MRSSVIDNYANFHDVTNDINGANNISDTIVKHNELDVSVYDIMEFGSKNDTDYRIYIMQKTINGDPEIKSDTQIIVSPFHDIELFPVNNDDSSYMIVNMIVEIPQFTHKKMEINKDVLYNPLMYDLCNDKIRTVMYHASQCPKNGYPFHYGALPQTWENPYKADYITGLKGDDDPLDCFDISSLNTMSGNVKQVKILGALAMIDDELMDWKLISINIFDPNVEQYNDITDIPQNIIHQIIDFLKNYKIANGKPPNKFYKKIFWSAEETKQIINDLHHEWKSLIKIDNNESLQMNVTKEFISENNFI